MPDILPDKIKRTDGSIFAVVDSMYADRTQFLKIRVVEDSDWLSVDDMWRLYIELGRILKNSR